MCPPRPGEDRYRSRQGAPAAPRASTAAVAVGAAGDLVLRQRADRVLLGRWRGALGDWLETAGGDPNLVETVVLAVNEAVTNAVEHAYRDRSPGEVTVRAHLSAAPAGSHGIGLVVEVSDHGHWRPAPPGPTHRGRGLAMMRALADRVERVPTPAGTTITMTWADPTSR